MKTLKGARKLSRAQLEAQYPDQVAAIKSEAADAERARLAALDRLGIDKPGWAKFAKLAATRRAKLVGDDGLLRQPAGENAEAVRGDIIAEAKADPARTAKDAAAEMERAFPYLVALTVREWLYRYELYSERQRRPLADGLGIFADELRRRGLSPLIFDRLAQRLRSPDHSDALDPWAVPQTLERWIRARRLYRRPEGLLALSAALLEFALWLSETQDYDTSTLFMLGFAIERGEF